MFVIINLGGALSVAIIFTIIVLMLEYLPPYGTSPYPNLFIASVSIIVGTILEFTRLKPRVFFIPVWFLGVIMLSFQLWALWRWVGILVTVSVVSAGLFTLSKLADKQFAKRLKQMIVDRQALLANLSNMDDASARKSLLSLFIGQQGFLESREALTHNLEITDAIRSKYHSLFVPEKTAILDAYSEALKNALSRSDYKWKTSGETKTVQNVLRSVLQ